jgi:hypothetical protein
MVMFDPTVPLPIVEDTEPPQPPADSRTLPLAYLTRFGIPPPRIGSSQTSYSFHNAQEIAGTGRRATMRRNQRSAAKAAWRRQNNVPALPSSSSTAAAPASPLAVPPDVQLILKGDYQATEGVLEGMRTVHGLGAAAAKEGARPFVMETPDDEEGRNDEDAGEDRREAETEAMAGTRPKGEVPPKDAIRAECRAVGDGHRNCFPAYFLDNPSELTKYRQLVERLFLRLLSLRPADVLEEFKSTFPHAPLVNGVPPIIAHLLDSVDPLLAHLHGLIIFWLQCVPPSGYTPMSRDPVTGKPCDNGPTSKLVRAMTEFFVRELEDVQVGTVVSPSSQSERGLADTVPGYVRSLPGVVSETTMAPPARVPEAG